eukprot:EC122428.1.p1 GENE.EC122428.1~~EC122428.1.p1  ORF type:complete len:106 (+),score=7.70 EC122428.1:83-400(+)
MFLSSTAVPGDRRPGSRNTLLGQKRKLTKLLQNVRRRLVAQEIKFADLARAESDCSSAKNGGDVGMFGRGQMRKPFEDAAFVLRIGEIRQVVESDSGLHLILRVA